MRKSSTSAPRARGPYASQACNVCRSKKSKCDGVRPVCSSCAASGRDPECTWGRDTSARKPRTEAHFEALQKRADALQAYADGLEEILSHCACQDVSARLQHLKSASILESPPPAASGSPNSGAEDSDTEWNDLDEVITQELTVPLKRLKLDNGKLLYSGITDPFRYIEPSEPDRLQPPMPERPSSPNPTYVLLVDGIDERDAHPNIDWSRHLPPELPLDRREHDKILDLSSKFWTGWFYRIPPGLFFRDMYLSLSAPPNHPPPRTPSYSPMLHNAVLALCSVFSDDPFFRDPNTRLLFADAARRRLDEECKKPEISLVHALAFLSTFYANLGDKFLGELYGGMSSRMCMTLGVGFDSTEWINSGLITQREMLGRNWAYWTIFCLEVRWALFFGREFAGPLADPRRPMTPPLVDAEADQLPWFHAPSGVPPQPNLFSLTFHQAAALQSIGRKILDVVNGLDRIRQDTVKVDQQVTKIDLSLNAWKSNLPPELDITLANKMRSTPHRLMLHCEYWLDFIVLHRPFFSPKALTIQNSDREIDHVKLCKRAAENILDLTSVWANLYTMRFTNVTMLQVLFGAGTVFVLLALQATASARIAHGVLQTALAQTEQCIVYLRDMGCTWVTATRTGDTLASILQDKAYPIIQKRLAHKGIRLETLLPMPSHPAPLHQQQTHSQTHSLASSRRPSAEEEDPNSQSAAVTMYSMKVEAEQQQQHIQSAPVVDWAHSAMYYPEMPQPGGYIEPNVDWSRQAQEVPEIDLAGFMPNFDLGAPELWYHQQQQQQQFGTQM
uniref:Zn(2)-C6 fungal-type domain-containing protein n=1 Tax=Mycena chlorophos TaxID=658473 RepID=A0ABQ0LP43_MYCCL|nr:predicted protein [Mycena chlorophos]